MCGRNNNQAAATATFAVGATVLTPKGSTGVIKAQIGSKSWVRTNGGKNPILNTADLRAPLPVAGDTVITPKGNRAVVQAVVGDQAWVLTKGGRNVVRDLGALRAA